MYCRILAETSIVDEGKRLGVSTPVNKVLTNLIRVRQKTYDEFPV